MKDESSVHLTQIAQGSGYQWLELSNNWVLKNHFWALINGTGISILTLSRVLVLRDFCSPNPPLQMEVETELTGRDVLPENRNTSEPLPSSQLSVCDLLSPEAELFLHVPGGLNLDLHAVTVLGTGSLLTFGVRFEDKTDGVEAPWKHLDHDCNILQGTGFRSHISAKREKVTLDSPWMCCYSGLCLKANLIMASSSSCFTPSSVSPLPLDKDKIPNMIFKVLPGPAPACLCSLIQSISATRPSPNVT